MTIADLVLIPTDVLVQELLDRCDHGCISYMRVGEHGPEDTTIYRRWKGNSFTIAGLAYDLARTVTTNFESNSDVLDHGPSDEGPLPSK